MFYSKCNIGYVVRVEVGEEIQDALSQFAQAVQLKGAFYQGIGTLTHVELAFFCIDAKEYERKFFNDQYEMISLMGNISSLNGSPAPHSHVTLSDRNFQTYSGHLVRGVVSVTAEICVTTIDLSLSRKEDPVLRYNGLISPQRTHLKIDA
jgi:predicted DNA-binding protein with PD1-like motif